MPSAPFHQGRALAEQSGSALAQLTGYSGSSTCFKLCAVPGNTKDDRLMTPRDATAGTVASATRPRHAPLPPHASSSAATLPPWTPSVLTPEVLVFGFLSTVLVINRAWAAGSPTRPHAQPTSRQLKLKIIRLAQSVSEIHHHQSTKRHHPTSTCLDVGPEAAFRPQ